MSSPLRKRLRHAIPASVRAEEAVFFITICCLPRGQNQLCFPDIATSMFESVAFRNRRGDWWVQLFLLMPDHLHALVSFPQNTEIGAVIAEWKKFAARNWRIRWQEGFFDHRLRSGESAQQKGEYILQNPVRAGIVDKPEDWPYVWWPTTD